MAVGTRVGWIGGGTKRDIFPVSKPIAAYTLVDGGPVYSDTNALYLILDQDDVEANQLGNGIQEASNHGEGYVYWLGLNREDLLRIFFGVRQWHVIVSAETSVVVFNGDHTALLWQASTFDMEFDITPLRILPSTSKIASERELCGFTRSMNASIHYDSSGLPDATLLRNNYGVENAVASGYLGVGAAALLFGMSFRRVGGLEGGYVEVSKDYWPWIEAEISAAVPSLASARSAYNDGSDNPPRTDYIGDLHLMAFGNHDVTTPMYGYRGHPTSNPLPDGSDLRIESLSVKFVPKKYWPFSTKDGDQVFDEDTRAVLHPPFPESF